MSRKTNTTLAQIAQSFLSHPNNAIGGAAQTACLIVATVAEPLRAKRKLKLFCMCTLNGGRGPIFVNRGQRDLQWSN